MKNLKKLAALLVALAMVFALVACSSSDDSDSNSGSDSEEAESVEEETEAEEEEEAPAEEEEVPAEAEESSSSSGNTSITVGWINDVEGFDPAFTNNAPGMDLVYDALFVNNPDTGELEGQLVESYEWIDDTHLQLTLYDATFSNGEPVTPQDVLFSYQYYIEVGSNLSTYFDGVYDFDNWEFIDDHTFVIAYCDPYGPGLSYLTMGKIQPESWYNENRDNIDNLYWDSPCGSGPYTVSEQVAGSYTTYTLRDDYWGEKPEATEITVKTYPEASTMYIDFENGELDMAWNLSSSDAERAQNDTPADSELVLQSKLDVTMFCMTMASDTQDVAYCEALQDIDVRHAIAIGVDWDAVAEMAYGVLYSTPTSSLPVGVNYRIEVGTYEYDRDAAKELLADAGYPDGFEFTMVTTTDDTTVKAAQALQAELLKLNITMDLESYEIATAIPQYFMTGAAASTIKVTGSGCDCYEPDQMYDTMKASSTNLLIAIYDSELDDLLMGGLKTVDTDERAELYAAAQQWLYDNYMAIPIAEPSIAYIYNTNSISSFVGGGGLFPNYRYLHLS